MKRLPLVFTGIALILSHLMCVVVASNYTSMLCAIEHQGFSAPASTAFIYAVPFIIGIAICIALALFFKKKKGAK